MIVKKHYCSALLVTWVFPQTCCIGNLHEAKWEVILCIFKNIMVNSEMVVFNGYLLMVRKFVGFTRNPELLIQSLPVYMQSIVTRTFQWWQQQRVHALSVRTFLIASLRLLLPCVSRCLNCDFMYIWLFFCQCKGSCWAFCYMVFSCCDKIDWRIYYTYLLHERPFIFAQSNALIFPV